MDLCRVGVMLHHIKWHQQLSQSTSAGVAEVLCGNVKIAAMTGHERTTKVSRTIDSLSKNCEVGRSEPGWYKLTTTG